MTVFCLGTVQFGLPYGVVDREQVPLDEAIACFEYAIGHGVNVIDTAAAYGNAEEVVGAFLRMGSVARETLTVSTKLLPNSLDEVPADDLASVVLERIEGSLKRLGTDYVDEYFLHSSRYAFRTDILEALQIVKDRGLARRIGVSVYDPDEALACFESGLVDVIQAPYSVLDHRMKDTGVFDAAAKAKCDVHVRSVFVKGLALMDEEAVPSYLDDAKPVLKKFTEVAAECGRSRIELALAYAKRHEVVSRLVVGVHSVGQLAKDVEAFKADIPYDVLDQLDSEFDGIPAEVVIPSLWKK